MKATNSQAVKLAMVCLVVLISTGCATKKPMELVRNSESNTWTVETDTSSLKSGEKYAVVVADCKRKKGLGRYPSRKICKKRDVVGLTIKEILGGNSAVIEFDRQINLGKSLEIEKRESFKKPDEPKIH